MSLGTIVLTPRTGSWRGAGVAAVGARRAAVPSVLERAHVVARSITLDAGPAGAGERVALPLPPSLAHAAPRRVATFLAGRYCARLALAGAGMPNGADVGRADDGAPVWPPEFAGSIAHTNDRAVAVVARRAAVTSVGVDCEVVMSAEAAAEVRDVVLSARERAVVGHAAGLDEVTLLTVVFSAKESVYKCLRPLVGRFFEFHDVHVTHVSRARDHGGRGHVHMRVAGELGADFPPGTEIGAAYEIVAGYVYTLVTLAAGDVPVATGGVSAR